MSQCEDTQRLVIDGCNCRYCQVERRRRPRSENCAASSTTHWTASPPAVQELQHSPYSVENDACRPAASKRRKTNGELTQRPQRRRLFLLHASSPLYERRTRRLPCFVMDQVTQRQTFARIYLANRLARRSCLQITDRH